MHEVQKVAIIKALRLLDSVKDHIGYAVEFDGEVHGNRTLEPIKTFKRKPRYAYGETRRHYAPFFKGAKIGDVIQVPFGTFDPSVLSSNISAACVHKFGKGNATVLRNEKTQSIEILISDIAAGADGQIEMF